MANLRTIIVCAVPAAITALFGLFWIFGKKKGSDKKAIEPPDKKETVKKKSDSVNEENSPSTNAVSYESSKHLPNSVDEICVKMNVTHNAETSAGCNNASDDRLKSPHHKSEETNPPLCDGSVLEKVVRSEEKSPMRNFGTADKELGCELGGQRSEIGDDVNKMDSVVQEEVVAYVDSILQSSCSKLSADLACDTTKPSIDDMSVASSGNQDVSDLINLNADLNHLLNISDMKKVEGELNEAIVINDSADSVQGEEGQVNTVEEGELNEAIVISDSADSVQGEEGRVNTVEETVKEDVIVIDDSILEESIGRDSDVILLDTSKDTPEVICLDSSNDSEKGDPKLEDPKDADEALLDWSKVPVVEEPITSTPVEKTMAAPSRFSPKCAKSREVNKAQKNSPVHRADAGDSNSNCLVNDNVLNTDQGFEDSVSEHCSCPKPSERHRKGCSMDKRVKMGSPGARDTGIHRDKRTKERSMSSPHSNDSVNGSDSGNCDNSSVASSDSGRGASVTDCSSLPTVAEEPIFRFNIPSDLCGLFIGSHGKNINRMKEQSGAMINLENNPFSPDLQICVIQGSQRSIDIALDMIRQKFPRPRFNLDFTPLPTAPSPPQANPVLMPEIMQLNLPEGVSVDIVVSSIVDTGHVFIQQPTHPSFPMLDRLNQFMLTCYSQEGMVPDIPRPIEMGVICAAPMLNGWYRAQIMVVHEESDECDIKYVDYGGYSRVASSHLKQIRSDFMTLPFQAVECYMANITPLQGESYFSSESAAILEELTQGKLLQAQVIGRSEDGIPYVHIYQISGNKALLVNRELVNRGVTRWIEILS